LDEPYSFLARLPAQQSKKRDHAENNSAHHYKGCQKAYCALSGHLPISLAPLLENPLKDLE
jgi:hypothetical protein